MVRVTAMINHIFISFLAVQMYKFSYTFRVQTSDISICAINTCEHQETFRTKRYVVCNGKGFLKQALFAQGVDNAIYGINSRSYQWIT